MTVCLSSFSLFSVLEELYPNCFSVSQLYTFLNSLPALSQLPNFALSHLSHSLL